MQRLSVAITLAATAALAACQQPSDDSAAANNQADQPVLNLPSVPRPQPPLDRAALLAAVTQAASASAAGTEMPESVRSLDGRQFELRIRFGCRGPSKNLGDRWLGWSFDSEERRVTVRAKPTISKDDPLIEQIVGEQFEAVEGFWIPRPWLQQPVCPAGAAVRSAPEEQQQAITATDPKPDRSNRQRQVQQRQVQQQQGEQARAAAAVAEADPQAEPVPSWPRIGIAQFFTDQDARTRRRDTRAYEARHTLAEGKALGSQGFNLVLSGRLRALPGRGVIECLARDSNSPPECVVSAEFLRVWIEQPDSKEVIAQWGGG